MNDPHVEWLRYGIQLGPTLRVSDPSPTTYEGDGFVARSENGELKASMTSHHPTVESAREQVEPFLRSWERHCDLLYGDSALRFRWKDAEVIERDPPPGGAPRAFSVQLVASITV